jgi:hypothetical protein
MTHAIELAELRDIDVGQLARMLAIAAAYRFAWPQGLRTVQAKLLEDATHRDARNDNFGRDHVAGHPLTPPDVDMRHNRLPGIGS